MANNRTEIVGMRELERTIRQLEQLPQKVVTKAARKGMNIALKSAKNNAPVDLGYLKKSLKLIGERRTVIGRKIYQVAPSSAFNDIFQRKTSSGKRVLKRDRSGKALKVKDGHYYYPASQEYGFIARNGRYIPGFRYLRKSIDEHVGEISETTVRVMTDEIDKIR